MNLRGRYEGGGMVVTAKHWWSPKQRKSARLAARILEVQGPKVREETQRRITHRLIYGYDPLD